MRRRGFLAALAGLAVAPWPKLAGRMVSIQLEGETTLEVSDGLNWLEAGDMIFVDGSSDPRYIGYYVVEGVHPQVRSLTVRSLK